jgi:DNA-binding CsgD family transcriptional regulator
MGEGSGAHRRNTHDMAVVRVTELNDDLVLVSVESCPAQGRALTPAEQEVVALAVGGLSNESIAKARGCSASTVANQLAASYRKLSVNGRRQLKVKVARS